MARDYRAEYARRIARGNALGLSRAQASGHPAKGQPKASEVIAKIKQQQPDVYKRAAAPRKAAPPKSIDKVYRGGKKITVDTHSYSKGKAAKSSKAKELELWEGKRMSKLERSLDAVASHNPSAKIRLTIFGKDGIGHTIYQNGGRSAKDFMKDYRASGKTLYEFLAGEFATVYEGAIDGIDDFTEFFGGEYDLSWEFTADA